jgi:hypothetical protein
VNVTGSVEGTSNKPKFALRSLFEKTVFPRISELVKPGGEYAGYFRLFKVITMVHTRMVVLSASARIVVLIMVGIGSPRHHRCPT